jgi:hypothetical protein
LDPRGCTPLTLGVAYDGRVIGRVLNADGREVGGVALTLVQTTAANALPQAQTRTAIDGRFELDRVQPGSYFLRVDAAPGVLGGIRFFRRALPATGDARRAVRVRVGAGKRVAVGTIDLPADTSLVTMTGNVVDDQGRPAAAAEVYLMDYPHIQLEPTQRAGDDGRFVIAVVEGHRYFVIVNGYISDARGRTRASFSGRATFVGGSSAPPISVVLKRHPR